MAAWFAAAQTSEADGSLSGTVRADDGTPIDRAVVMVLGSDGPAVRSGVTGTSGEFVIEGLPAGSFAVWVTKSGFVTSYHGSRRPGRGPAIPLALTARQRLSVSITMLRGASIGGKITDSAGRPLAQVSVQVHATSDPRTTATVVATSTTDSHGGYRAIGLPPGEYVVEALPPSMPDLPAVQVTTDEVKWALQHAQQGPGRALLPPAPAHSGLDGAVVAYAPTYFPGVAIGDQAVRVSVGPGEQRDDANFSLQLIGAAKITGRVVVPRGQPMSGVNIALVPTEPTAFPVRRTGPGATAASLHIPVADTGEFAVGGLVPGSYELWARWDPNPPTSPGPDTLWAHARVVVNGFDLSGLVLSLQPGARVSGTVRLYPESQRPAMDSVRIALSTQLTAVAPFIRTLVARPDATGRFFFPSVPSGPYDLRTASGEPTERRRWVLESATLSSGQDVADGTLNIQPDEEVAGVIVTMTDQETEISGTLLDAARRPTAQFSVLFFSADRSRWTTRSRRVQVVQPASDGTFRVRGLPAGEYLVVGDASVDPDTPLDAEYLEQLAGIAGRLTLAQGEKRRVDLAIAGR
jgi:hypothetical protein